MLRCHPPNVLQTGQLPPGSCHRPQMTSAALTAAVQLMHHPQQLPAAAAYAAAQPAAAVYGRSTASCSTGSCSTGSCLQLHCSTTRCVTSTARVLVSQLTGQAASLGRQLLRRC
jgi:hypothetical protein